MRKQFLFCYLFILLNFSSGLELSALKHLGLRFDQLQASLGCRSGAECNLKALNGLIGVANSFAFAYIRKKHSSHMSPESSMNHIKQMSHPAISLPFGSITPSDVTLKGLGQLEFKEARFIDDTLVFSLGFPNIFISGKLDVELGPIMFHRHLELRTGDAYVEIQMKSNGRSLVKSEDIKVIINENFLNQLKLKHS